MMLNRTKGGKQLKILLGEHTQTALKGIKMGR